MHATPVQTFQKRSPFYVAQAPIFCLCLVLLLTLRATRAPCRSWARRPSTLGVEVSADASTFEYKRHRVCPSVKTSTDQPFHVPLSTHTHFEARRSLELRNLPFQPCPREPRAGVSVASWRLSIGSDIVPHIYIYIYIYIYCFQICNRLVELMKNGDAGTFLFITALSKQYKSRDCVLFVASNQTFS